MKEVVKKEILYDLSQTIEILEVKEEKDWEELQELSNHAIEDVAAHKDLDLISTTVLIYSLYKVIKSLSQESRDNIVKELKRSHKSLEDGNLGKYNSSLKKLYRLIELGNEKVKQHLEDVMHAARIKKGTALLHKGLSIGQAAGLMGLTNWELQEYVGKTTVQDVDHEAVTAKKRLQNAMKIFGA